MLTQTEYRRLKSKLTRAQNSGDPLKILAATREAFDSFETTSYPDSWHRWKVAESDAIYQLQRTNAYR